MSEFAGKAKEKVGDLAGDGDLKREGQTDQAAAKIKDGVDKVADKIKNALHKD